MSSDDWAVIRWAVFGIAVFAFLVWSFSGPDPGGCVEYYTSVGTC